MDSQKIVKDLLNEFKESDLTEFEMETAELRLRFGRGVNAGSGMASGNSFAQNNPAAERVSGNAAAPAASASETVKENAPAASALRTPILLFRRARRYPKGKPCASWRP